MVSVLEKGGAAVMDNYRRHYDSGCRYETPYNHITYPQRVHDVYAKLKG